MSTPGGQPRGVVDPANWVDSHGETLYRFALSRLRDVEAAEEAMFDAKRNWRFDPRVLKGRPEVDLEREDFWQAFRHCLQRLSQRQADAFTRREIENVSSNEICKELGISASNLWVLLHRA